MPNSLRSPSRLISHFSTYNSGGAAIAARRIFDGLRTQLVADVPRPKVEMQMVCRSDQTIPDEQTVHFRSEQPRFYRWIPRRLNQTKFASKHFQKHLEHRPQEFEAVSPAVHYDPTALPADFRPDLIHLHWVAWLFDYISFFDSIPARTPIVWTLHDMNAFTGGCHYSAGCERYRTGCGNCFQMDNPAPDDVSKRAIRQKKRAYRGHSMTIVAPSQWLLELARTSGVFPRRTQYEYIPYGLDTQTLQPMEKSAAKRELGATIDRDLSSDVVLLFGADDFSIRRKGILELREALGQLQPEQSVTCAVFGNGKLEDLIPDSLPANLNLVSIGYLSDDQQRRMAYSAADLFVMPSLEDNQPQTGLEAMACGTPVVAFGTGGMPDSVRPDQTGRLAKAGDASSLATEISVLIESQQLRESLGKNARQMICTEFELHRQTQKYIALYERLLGDLRHTASVA